VPEPLRKIDLQGNSYARRGEIERKLIELENLSPPERLKMLSVSQRSSLHYISSEVLVYFLRQASREQKTRQTEYEELFRLLIKRVDITLRSQINDTLMPRANEIREAILDKLIDIIADDYRQQSTRLDYYEVNFDDAFASSKITVLRKLGPAKNQTIPLFSDETGEVLPEVEAAAYNLFSITSSPIDDPAFRSAVLAAIDKLPDEQKQVMGMLVLGIPIDSNDPKVNTISRILNCNEKTVRNRRDRAIKTLREQFKEELTQ
jgi:DNA-directed RNA polymerase specialized sigma24 family protein